MSSAKWRPLSLRIGELRDTHYLDVRQVFPIIRRFTDDYFEDSFLPRFHTIHQL